MIFIIWRLKFNIWEGFRSEPSSIAHCRPGYVCKVPLMRVQLYDHSVFPASLLHVAHKRAFWCFLSSRSFW